MVGDTEERSVDWFVLGIGAFWLVAQWMYAATGWPVPGLVAK